MARIAPAHLALVAPVPGAVDPALQAPMTPVLAPLLPPAPRDPIASAFPIHTFTMIVL